MNSPVSYVMKERRKTQSKKLPGTVMELGIYDERICSSFQPVLELILECINLQVHNTIETGIESWVRRKYIDLSPVSPFFSTL